MLVYKCDPDIKKFSNTDEKMKECKEFFSISTIQGYLKHNNFFDMFKFWDKAASHPTSPEGLLFNCKHNAEVLAYVLYEKCGIDFTKYMTQKQLYEIKKMQGGVMFSLIETDEEK